MNEEILIADKEILPEDAPVTEPLCEDGECAEDEANVEGESAPDIAEVDTEPAEAETESGAETVEFLKKELEYMRRELEEKRSAFERMSRELGEFEELYPEKSPSSIPDSVWDSVRAGIPLAAAYALYEKRSVARLAAAAKINERNGARSTGSLGRETTENFFTPDEVRAMSRDEVRTNYQKILESMKKWN